MNNTDTATTQADLFKRRDELINRRAEAMRFMEAAEARKGFYSPREYAEAVAPYEAELQETKNLLVEVNRQLAEYAQGNKPREESK